MLFRSHTTFEDFEKMVSGVAGADMSDFFKRCVRGVESPPYEEAFAQVGLRFVTEPRLPVAVGITADENETTAFKISRVRPDSPASQAGLDVGDVITSFGGTKLSPANFMKTLGRYKPGDRVTVTVQRGQRTIQVTLTLGTPQILNYRIEENPNASAEAKALRAAWMIGR